MIINKSRLDELDADDRKFYEEAVAIADESLKANEVPVGCVIVYKDKVIARGHNEVNRRRNPIYHAEMVAIDQVYKWCKDSQLSFAEIIADSCLYVTLEPCCMCASGLYQLRLRRVVYGSPNARFGGMGSVMSNADYKHEHEIDTLPNVDVERTIEALRTFYKFENPFAPPEKRKTRNKLQKGEGS